jgi:uncharacterized membrane protein
MGPWVALFMIWVVEMILLLNGTLPEPFGSRGHSQMEAVLVLLFAIAAILQLLRDHQHPHPRQQAGLGREQSL